MVLLHPKKEKMETTILVWQTKTGTSIERSRRMASPRMKSKISPTFRSLKTKSLTLTLNSSSFFSARKRCLQLKTSRFGFGLIATEVQKFSSSLPLLVSRAKECLRFSKTCLTILEGPQTPSVLTCGRMQSLPTTDRDFSHMYS